MLCGPGGGWGATGVGWLLPKVSRVLCSPLTRMLVCSSASPNSRLTSGPLPKGAACGPPPPSVGPAWTQRTSTVHQCEVFSG